MGYFSIVQTLWASGMPALSQVARIQVTGGAAPVFTLHDVAGRQMLSGSLGAGPLVPEDLTRQTTGRPGTRIDLELNGRTRTLEMQTIARQENGASGTLTYLDESGFTGDLVALLRYAAGGRDYLGVAPVSGAGISVFRVGNAGTLTPVQQIADDEDHYLNRVSALGTVALEGRQFLVAASISEHGVSSFEINAWGKLRQADSFGIFERLPVDHPTALETVTMDGQAFVLLSAFGTGSLTVLRLAADGNLIFVDQINDDLHSRFGGTTAIDTITVQGQVLVAAAGNDGGVALLQMLPDGRLVHLESLADSSQSALQNVRQLQFAEIDGRIELFALSSGDAGLTRLALDLGAIGITGRTGSGTDGRDVLTAPAGGAHVQGGSGNDILLDSAGPDHLSGGPGADLFLFHPDEQADVVSDFDPSEDRIELSGFGDLSAIGDFQTVRVPGGLMLRWGRETLTVLTDDGHPLAEQVLLDNLALGGKRIAMPEVLPSTGSAGNDLFTWSLQPDTIDGGNGYDVITYAAATEAVTVSLADGSRNAGAARGDVLQRIEGVTGTRFDDELVGDTLGNAIVGLAGNDRLIGGAGNDWITPGSGSDVADGGPGSDMVSFVDLTAPVVVKFLEGTALSGGETDRLSGFEHMTGTIHGDYLQGDHGSNRIRGLGDYDWMVGSGGGDLFEGGTGRDMVSYVFSPVGVQVDLGAGRGLTGQAAGDRYVDVERITGSVHEDMLRGSAGEDDFRGLGGYDWFVGSGGGKDRYDGGTGLDMVAYSQAPSGVVASLLLGRGSQGDAARDLYTSIENLTGSSHGDQLTGDHGRNRLRGMYGEDTLIGNGGVDRLEGGKSDDFLDGGDSWDYALFAGRRSEYTIVRTEDSTIVRHNLLGGDGTDTLINIEALQFSDDVFYL